MHVSDGIHHVPQGGPRGLELGLGLKTYMCTVCTISSFLLLDHTQVLQASSGVPLQVHPALSSNS